MIEEIEATGSSSDPPRKLDSPVVLLAVSPGDGWAMRNADNTIGEGALVLSSWEQPPGFDSREGRSLVSATMYTSQASLGESGQPWRTAYEKRFQQAPGRDALVTWDALQFVLAGFQEVKGAYRVRLKPELAGRTSFESITGTMRWREGRPVRTLYLVRQEKGKTTLLRTIPLPET
jgi:ABC-type branched-subunit amino acid transport system substrate-binding protein